MQQSTQSSMRRMVIDDHQMQTQIALAELEEEHHECSLLVMVQIADVLIQVCSRSSLMVLVAKFAGFVLGLIHRQDLKGLISKVMSILMFRLPAVKEVVEVPLRMCKMGFERVIEYMDSIPERKP